MPPTAQELARPTGLEERLGELQSDVDRRLQDRTLRGRPLAVLGVLQAGVGTVLQVVAAFLDLIAEGGEALTALEDLLAVIASHQVVLLIVLAMRAFHEGLCPPLLVSQNHAKTLDPAAVTRRGSW